MKEGNEQIWLKAAVAGSIWASVEIIAGSALHNMRVPFSGSLLAAMGVILLTAFAMRWRTTGMFWRAGLICALMKSVSPSAVILGPMTGILLEAVLLELGFRIFRFGLAGAVLGGIMAVSSALLHKIISLTILYGSDILTIYVNIFHYAAKQVRVADAGVTDLLLILIAGYALLGSGAGYLGYLAGKKQGLQSTASDKTAGWPERKTGPALGLPQHLAWFFLHLAVLPLGLVAISVWPMEVYLPLTGLYLVMVLFRYRGLFQRLANKSFWIQLLIVAVLSSLFFRNPADDWTWINRPGLRVGLEMMLRAVFVVITFRALSFELRHPAIRQFLQRIGFRKTSEMLEVAFGMLPAVVQGFPPVRQLFLHPVRSLGSLVVLGDRLLEEVKYGNVEGDA